MTNPLYAWIELLRSRPAITALVASNHITLDLPAPEVPEAHTHLTLSAITPFRDDWRRVWTGVVRLTAMAPQMHAAQAVIDAAMADLYDDLTRSKLFHLESGSQAGAVITVTGLFNLVRTGVALSSVSGDVYRPAWSVDLETSVSMEAMLWA